MAPSFALSPHSACLSGSAGSITATGNQHGRYFIDRPTITDAMSDRQVQARNKWKQLGPLWRGMYFFHRDRWDDYAARMPMPGDACHPQRLLTGQNHFFRVNQAPGLWTTLYRPYAPPRLGFGWYTPPTFVFHHFFTFTIVDVYLSTNDPWHQLTPVYYIGAGTFDRPGYMFLGFSNPQPNTINFYNRAFPHRFTIRYDDPSPTSFLLPVGSTSADRFFTSIRVLDPWSRLTNVVTVRSL